ncbi:MAG: acyl-CoA dehydrogenase [Saprospiraceae bacterium]|nr:acyl-CoA dehydrogenase [Saprospiraceae bacterium]
MASQYFSLQNLRFLLHEVFRVSELSKITRFEDYEADAIDLVLDAAKQIGDQYLYPIHREMDKNKAYFEDGQVHTLPGLNKAIQAIAEGGWINAHLDGADGGQQMPLTVMNAGLFIFYAANSNAAPYAFLTQGAANLIHQFGSAPLKDVYLDKMYSGTWQGTMALTEPQAGSSLSDLTSTAQPGPDGDYLIQGQKIYISGGDYSGVENIVHLTLARIEGAPAGTHGISLFVVPKFLVKEGRLVSNNVTTAGIYGKMGQRGYTAAHLMLGEQGPCKGYLVGAPNKGLSYMFNLMNEARIGTGNLATGTASAAFYASLQYANERPQGRHPGQKDPTSPQEIIIEHADVRRMLLFQKSVVEGSLALVIQASLWADLAENSSGEEAENAHLLLELITPIVKSYPSEQGNYAVSAGMQVLGGAGYTDDFPLEQYYRDIRVNSIYEGTTTIHGMDLLGRKLMVEKGKALKLFMGLVQQEIQAAETNDALSAICQQLASGAKGLHQTTMSLMKLASEKGPQYFLADATLYLEAFSIVTIGWLWLKQLRVAETVLAQGQLSEADLDFYRGKKLCGEYFFAYDFLKIQPLLQRLSNQDGLTVDMESSWIN